MIFRNDVHWQSTTRKKTEALLFDCRIDSTKIGAHLTTSRWAVLLAKVDIIDEALNDLFTGVDDVNLRYHLDSAWWILVKSAYYFGVDIHKFSLPRDGKQQKLAGPGITLAWEEWQSLKQLITMIHEHYRPLSTALPCHQYPMHDRQVCLECNLSSLHKH